MRLQPLHLVERRQPGVGIVEPDHEAVRHQVVAEMVEPRAAIGPAVQRPAHGVLHQARPVLRCRHLPQLLDAEPVGLRVDATPQVEPLHQLLGQRAAAALREQRVGRTQLHPPRVVRTRLAVAADPHVAGGDADDAAFLLQQLGRPEARVDLDPERFRLACEPAAHVAEADDVVAVVAHLRRHRQGPGAPPGQVEQPVLGRRGVERRTAFPPVRDQLVKRTRLDHRTGQDVRADLRTLLDQADGSVGRKLFQPDRGRESGRTAADHDHVEFHRLAQLTHQRMPVRT